MGDRGCVHGARLGTGGPRVCLRRKGLSGCPQVQRPDGKGVTGGGEGVREVRYMGGKGVHGEEREKWEKESGIRKEKGRKGERWGERKGQGKGESEAKRGWGEGREWKRKRGKGERGVPRRGKGSLVAGAGLCRGAAHLSPSPAEVPRGHVGAGGSAEGVGEVSDPRRSSWHRPGQGGRRRPVAGRGGGAGTARYRPVPPVPSPAVPARPVPSRPAPKPIPGWKARERGR